MTDKKQQERCALCGKILPISTQEKSMIIVHDIIIDGTHYRFDTKDCATMFKRFMSVYKNSFKEDLLGQQQFISDPFWDRVIPKEHEIKEVEEGLQTEIIKVIRDSNEIQKLGFDLLRSAKENVEIIFSTANAFHRQKRIGGIIQLLEEIKTSDKNLNVRILSPTDDDIKKSISPWLKERLDIDVRNIDEYLRSDTTITLLLVDRRFSLSVELKDGTKNENYHKPVILGIYSDSKSVVLTYITIFESLWKELELNERVIRLCEQLRSQEKMQQEFINIAAHELRAPIQPILGLAEALRSKRKVIDPQEQEHLLSVIIRNAKRLKTLTEDILDITRIESGSLNLHKEILNIDNVIIDAMQDIKSQMSGNKKTIRLLYPSKIESDTIIVVDADKARLIQVMTNLLGNAINFTEEEGTISVNLEKKNNNVNNNNKEEEVLVSVKDTGIGIDEEIMPLLFRKFVTKSEKGTGLGLYISKSIIEAHHGRMWAENNKDGKGATFSFSLPITTKHQD